MGLFDRKRRRREDMAMLRRVVDDTAEKPWYHFSPSVWKAVALTTAAVALALVCFWERPPHLPVLLPDTKARVRYDAQFAFRYESLIQQEQLRAKERLKTPPVYRVAVENSAPALEKYRNFIKTLATSYDTLKALPEDERAAACQKIIVEEQLPGMPEFLKDGVLLLIAQARNDKHLATMLGQALDGLTVLLRNGIFNGQGELRLQSSRSMELSAADKYLRDQMDSISSHELAIGLEQEALREALLTLFRPALQPNVEIDLAATGQRQQVAMAKVLPVIVEIQEGTPLTLPGEEITPPILERWNAYRHQMASHEKTAYGLQRTLTEHLATALGLITLLALYNRVAPSPRPGKRRNITLTALMVLLNLFLVRLMLELGESPLVLRTLAGNGAIPVTDILFWMTPPALAPILVTMLAGPPMALNATLLVATFSAMMLGRNPDLLFIAILSSLTGIYFSNGARNRGAVVRAGLMSGLAVAIPVFFICTINQLPPVQVLWQATGCLVGGLLTGIVAVGILPLLESLFKITTNITLLELTDYDHPLLRKLQIIAPGTFHHSVTVANLAERAAAEINANALLCRCAALFHDVGKMVKPEYFIENQRQDTNPHATVSPSMSALIIKSHVREGIEIAREYKLPRIIIDVIEQHHGTGLIQYFYYKAKQLAQVIPATDPAPADTTGRNAVDETTFRYDGPRPRTKEAAIVLLADSVEAASRSLKKVTPQSIKELVHALIADRIADTQMDNSPLTFRELQRIRESLQSSLLNMLHSRIEYPKDPAR